VHAMMCLFKVTATCSDHTTSNSRRISEFGRMCKEVIVAEFEVISQRLPGWTKDIV
jgi:hypothetical protein